jgi:hypothetical protein
MDLFGKRLDKAVELVERGYENLGFGISLPESYASGNGAVGGVNADV